jgi:hypothetical protein
LLFCSLLYCVSSVPVPEQFGGTPLDPKTEVQTFAMISEEISRGDACPVDLDELRNPLRNRRGLRLRRRDAPPEARGPGSRVSRF